MSSSVPPITNGSGEDEAPIPLQLIHSKRGTNIYRHGSVGYKVLMCPEEDCQEASDQAAAMAPVSEEQILKLVREQTISRILPNGCNRRRAVDVKGFKGNPALYFQWVEGKSLMQWMNEQHAQEEEKANNGGTQEVMVRRLRVAISITKTLNDFHYGGVVYNFLSLDHIILQWTGNNTDQECCIASLINLSRAEVLAELSEQEAKEAIRKDLNDLGHVLDALFSGESDVSLDVERRLSDDILLELDENNNTECDHQSTVKKRWKQRSLGDGLPTYLSSMISAMVGDDNADASGLYDNVSDVLKDLQVAAQKPGLHLIPNLNAEERNMESLVMSNTFHGRRNEVALLSRTMQTVAILGKPNIAVVSGRGGAGKTTLINQIKKPLEDINGRFIQVKFDFNTQPDTVLFSALDSFIEDIHDDEEGRELKQRIKGALGSEMSVVANSIPSIAKLIDKSASKISTAAEDSTIHQQEQMKCAMCKLIGSIATTKSPVVLFLDDLHWADKSLDVIERLFVSPDISHCFFLACYRDNDLTLAKPVESMLERVQNQEGISIIKVPLGGLELDCTHEFISETLSLPPNLKAVRQLANVVHHKTGGLVLYMKNFLCELCEEGLLCFKLNRRWQFNLGKIMYKDVSDDVVKHLMQRIARLAKSRYLLGLRIASCLGSSFSVKTFQTVTNMEGVKFDDFVQFVECNGFIHRTKDTMKWVHDNVQQAAYKTISISKIESMHLLIGGRLLIRSPNEDLDECVFDIVHHMNKGINLIRTPEQKVDGARLNLRAGQKAMCSLSFHSAAKYCISGIKILGNESWGVNYDLTIDLHYMAGKALLAIGDHESIKAIATSILDNATCFEDEVFAHSLQMRYLTSVGQFDEVVQNCKDLLQRLDEPLPTEISKNVIIQEYARTKAKLDALTEEDILALPEMKNKQKATAMLILGYAVNAAVISQPYLAPLLSFRGVNLTLDHGVSSLSAPCFATYGCWLVSNQISDFEGGFRMGQVATKLMNRQGENKNPRVFVAVYGLVNVWRQPFQACRDMLLEGYELGIRQGNIDNAFNCLLLHGQMNACCGSPLHEVVESYRLYCKNTIMYQEHVKARALVGHLQLALSLTGSIEDAYRTFFGISKNDYENSAIQASIESHKVGYHSHIKSIPQRNKLLLLLTDGPDKEIQEWCELEQRLDSESLGLFPRKIHGSFIDGMIGFSFARKYKDDREKWEELGISMISRFQRWTESSEWNFENKLYLLMAERYFLQDDQENAFKHYDKAIKASGDHRFLHEEGLANVAAAKCCLHYGKTKEGLVYYSNAKDCYRRWGANALVSMIDKKCSEL